MKKQITVAVKGNKFLLCVAGNPIKIFTSRIEAKREANIMRLADHKSLSRIK